MQALIFFLKPNTDWDFEQRPQIGFSEDAKTVIVADLEAEGDEFVDNS